MARAVLRLAEECSQNRIAFLLEGGYDLTALRDSVASVLNEMRGGSGVDALAGASAERIQPLINAVLSAREK
jgi:acetoin utilization deacetylase AcuC-like enzyme